MWDMLHISLNDFRQVFILVMRSSQVYMPIPLMQQCFITAGDRNSIVS